MIRNLKIKRETILKNSRKLKKKTSRKVFINQINSFTLTYNLLAYFLYRQNIFINNKVLAMFLVTENGVSFSFKK